MKIVHPRFPRNQPRWATVQAVLVPLIALALTACGQPDGPTVARLQQTQQTPTATATLEPTTDVMEQFPILPTLTRGPELQTQIAKIEANETAVAAYFATSDALPTTLPDDGLPIKTPQPTPTFTTGIQACDFVDQSGLLGIWTCWHGIQGDQYQTVLTGAKPRTMENDTTAAGGIKVCTLLIVDRSGGCSNVYWLPVKAGKLIIVAVTWPHVVVEAANGTRYGFNAETLMWEEPQAVPPTNTPTALPTNTPTTLPTSTPTALPTATATALPTSTALPAITNAAVRPVLECVRVETNGQYTAFFGYKNDNTAALTIAVGPNNRFSPNPQGRGQTTQFASGRQVSVFGVAFDGTNLVWSLKGPDGQNRTATAASGSKRCAP